MSKPKKYEDLDFTPPKNVAAAAERGLKLRREHDRGGTQTGVARARDLKNQRDLSPSTVKRMVSYFARHEVDKRASNFGDKKDPSAGYIAWLLWGGDPGKRWSEKLMSQMGSRDGS